MARRELLALLEACKRDPEDDAARLVLADWLEEHGDEDDRERADFVRLNATSGEAKGRPDFYWLRMRRWHERRAQWAPFQAALRKSVHAENDNGLVGAFATTRAMNAPRGLRWAGREEWAWVERLTVMPKIGELTEVLASPLLATVATLDLYEPELASEDISAFQWSPGLARLRGLWLTDGWFRDLMPLYRSAHAAGLRSLRFSGSWVCERDVEALGRPGVLPALEDLELPENSATAALCMRALTAPGRRLRSLAIRHGLRKQDVRALGEADSCSGLRSLDLRPRPARLDCEALAAARFWATLESFRTTNCPLTERGAATLAAVDAPRLREFAVLDEGRSADGLRRLAGWSGFAQLNHLDVRGQPLGPAGVAALTAMPAAPLALDLRGCGIGDEGLFALARWPGVSRCRVLHLAKNGLTAEGMRALADSPHLGGLVGLNVVSNPIGDDGIEALMSAPWLGGLEHLLVSNCGGGTGGAAALFRSATRMPRMKELDVGREMFSTALREAFAHAPYVE
jgi:uncharacterized protein (TIGR02996 family)